MTSDPIRTGCENHPEFEPGCLPCWTRECDRLRTALERIWEFDKSDTVRHVFKAGTRFGEIASEALKGLDP